LRILGAALRMADKEDARSWFYEVRQSFLDLNGSAESAELYARSLADIEKALADRQPEYDAEAKKILARLE
ncbi:MAG: V-type ATP synthase subunit A, partial [Spirochaetales bacterium]